MPRAHWIFQVMSFMTSGVPVLRTVAAIAFSRCPARAVRVFDLRDGRVGAGFLRPGCRELRADSVYAVQDMNRAPRKNAL